MSAETVKVLHGLKRRIGKERAFYDRVNDEKFEQTGQRDERATGESNVCGIIMSFIDEELTKLKPAAPDPPDSTLSSERVGRGRE